MAQAGPKERPERRLRSAWHVLIGRRTTPLQVQAEWLEYKLIFEDILTRLGAQLARVAKAEQKRLERQMDPEPRVSPLGDPRAQRKAELRQRVAMMRGTPVKNGVEEAP